jgi:hypothetical protein
MFFRIDPSVKLQHSWSKLCETYEGNSKSYREVFESHKKVVIMIILYWLTRREKFTGFRINQNLNPWW